MELKIGNEWDEVLAEEKDKPYFSKISAFLDSEYKNYTIYPPRSLIFAALKYVPFSDVKVVIVGQDPYINPGQANGLAFAVGEGVRFSQVFSRLRACRTSSRRYRATWAWT